MTDENSSLLRATFSMRWWNKPAWSRRLELIGKSSGWRRPRSVLDPELEEVVWVGRLIMAVPELPSEPLTDGTVERGWAHAKTKWSSMTEESFEFGEDDEVQWEWVTSELTSVESHRPGMMSSCLEVMSISEYWAAWNRPSQNYQMAGGNRVPYCMKTRIECVSVVWSRWCCRSCWKNLCTMFRDKLSSMNSC